MQIQAEKDKPYYITSVWTLRSKMSLRLDENSIFRSNQEVVFLSEDNFMEESQ